MSTHAHRQAVLDQVFGAGVVTSSDFVRFERLTYAQALQLLHAGVLEPEERQNDAPTTEELLAFGQQYPNEVEYEGYVVNPPRDDMRVTLEAVCLHSATPPEFPDEWVDSASEQTSRRLWWD